ncbi:hypothetical protein [Streptococcus sp. S784/96/1]|nr:hypothetical protein [Streptococcus sp. S784/96/1]
MIIGVASAQIKLAKEFLAERNDNPNYRQALDDLSGLLLAQLEENMEDCL